MKHRNWFVTQIAQKQAHNPLLECSAISGPGGQRMKLNVVQYPTKEMAETVNAVRIEDYPGGFLEGDFKRNYDKEIAWSTDAWIVFLYDFVPAVVLLRARVVA